MYTYARYTSIFGYLGFLWLTHVFFFFNLLIFTQEFSKIQDKFYEWTVVEKKACQFKMIR